MVKFYLTKKAVTDLGNIWDFIVEIWSENQAEIYNSLLMDACQDLANKPSRGKSYEKVEKNVLGFKTGPHVIFYQTVSKEEIEIVRILHGMMDMKYHL